MTLDGIAGLRAARWTRESSVGQADRFGPASQRERQDDSIKRYRLIDTGIGWSVAHSGRTIDRTPEWADMLAAAGARYDILLVGYISRFTRDLRIAVNTRHDLHDRGAVILFADERILSSDDASWDNWAREQVEAESYSRRLAKRVKQGLAAKVSQERDYGSGEVSYGFRRINGLVEPNPDTMPTAIEAYRLSGEGLTDGQVAAALGLTLWTVRTILRSSLYAGVLPDGRETRFPAPVPLPYREASARVRTGRSSAGYTPRHRVYPLTDGPLVCDDCGRSIKGVYRTDVKRRFHRHPDACASWSPKEARADDHEAQVAQMLDGARPDRLMASMVIEALRGPSVAPDRLAIARIEAEMRKVALSLVERDDRGALARLDDLRARRAAIEATPVAEDQPTAEEALEYLASLGPLWRETSDEGRRAIARATFARLGAIGGRIVSVEVTPAAERRGLALALPPVLSSVTTVGGTGFEPVTSSV